MKRALSIVFAAGWLAACGDSTGPQGPHLSNVAVSFATTTPTNAPPGFAAAAPGASNALVLTSVQFVLREIEIKREEVVECDTDPEPEGCEEFEAGPVLVSLPLDGSVDAAFELPIDSGRYDEIEFDIHKVSSGDSVDAAFIAQHPEFEDLSIRVTGTFNGNPFVFESDLDVEQELDLNPSLVIDGSDPNINLTIAVGLDRWFRDASGAQIDPATGNKGGTNESLIKENIKQSIEAFEDDDRDGSRT